MKKLFKRVAFLFAALMSLSVTTANVKEVNAAGEGTYSYTFTAKQFTANATKKLGDISWTLSGDGGYWGYDSTKGQQFGSGNAPYKSLTLSTSDFNDKVITKVSINTSGASSVAAKFDIKIGDTTVSSSNKLTTSATTYTSDELNNSGNLSFVYTQTSSKAIYIKKIEVVYKDKVASSTPIEQVIGDYNTDFSLSFDYGLYYSNNTTSESVTFKDQNYENASTMTNYTGELFSIDFHQGSGSNAPLYYSDGEAVRLYQYTYFVVKSLSSKKITKVVFTYGINDKDAPISASVGMFSENTWSGSANEIKFSLGGGGQRRLSSVNVVFGGELENSSFANVSMAIGTKINANIFSEEAYKNYEITSGGILLANAADYKNTTLAETYNPATFKGIRTEKTGLTAVKGYYTVGSVVEIINGLVNDENKDLLSKEFVAAAYFVVTKGQDSMTVVLKQKIYSVSSMVKHYIDNFDELFKDSENLNKTEINDALLAFDSYIG